MPQRTLPRPAIEHASAPPVDTIHLSAGAPAGARCAQPPPTRFAARVSQVVLAALSRTCGVLLYTAPTAAPDPDTALAAACGNDAARATRFRDALKRMPCPSDAERDQMKLTCATILTKYGRSDTLLQALGLMASSGDGAASLRGFDALLTATPNLELALKDLQVALAVVDAHPTVAQPEVFGSLAALRRIDPQRNNRYPRYGDLTSAARFLMAEPDAAARQQATDRLVALHANGRTVGQAMDFEQRLRALTCSSGDRDRVRDQFVTLLQGTPAYAHTSLTDLLDALQGRRDAVGELAYFQALHAASSDLQVAVGDLKAVQTAADSHPGVPADELVAVVQTLRKADPQRNAGSGRATALEAVLNHVAAQPDAASRQATTNAVIALQQGGRNAAQAVEYERRLEGIVADAVALRSGVTELLKTHGTYEDDAIKQLLDGLQGRPHAAEEFAGLTKLLAASGNTLPRAVADLKLAQEQTTAVPFDETLTHLAAMRQADPQRNNRTWTELAQPLAWVLGGADAAAREQRRQTLAGLQVGGRNAEQALHHETKLEALGGSAADVAELRAAYVAELKKTYTSTDDTLLGVLDTLKGRADALAGFKAYVALSDATKNAPRALGDLTAAQKLAGDHAVSMTEAVEHVVTLRTADPNRGQRRPHYEDLDAAVDHVLGGADAAVRASTAKRVAALFAQGRPIAGALALEQASRPLAATDGLFEAWRALLQGKDARQDDAWLKVLQAVDGRPRALAEMQAAGKLALSPEVTLQDLRLVQKESDAYPTLALGEITDRVVGLRAAEGRHKSDLAPAADLILGAADAEERQRLADAETRLLGSEQDGPHAAEDLAWILHDPTTRGTPTAERIPTFAERVETFVNLRGYAEPESRDAVRHMYERILADGMVEHQGWLKRLFHRPKRMVALVQKLLELKADAGAAGAWLEAVEQGRLEDESLRSSFSRFKKLWKYSKGDTATGLRDTFVRVRAPLAWGSLTEKARWKTVLGLVKETGSSRHAGSIWRAMASAATDVEANSRRTWWKTLHDSVGEDVDPLYDAIIDNLGATGRIEGEMPVILDLLDQQGGDLAARSYAMSCSLGAQYPGEAVRVRGILASARKAEQLDALFERVHTPVGAEDLPFRTAMLDQLVSTVGPNGAVADYDAAVQMLKPDGAFESMGPSYAAFLAMLRRMRIDGRSRGPETLAWLKELHAADPDGTPVADMLMDLNISLLLKADFDAARSALLAREETRRKARNGQGRIDKGEDEVAIGGIKVKVRKTR